jgi:hypothetical protein
MSDIGLPFRKKAAEVETENSVSTALQRGRGKARGLAKTGWTGKQAGNDPRHSRIAWHIRRDIRKTRLDAADNSLRGSPPQMRRQIAPDCRCSAMRPR